MNKVLIDLLKTNIMRVLFICLIFLFIMSIACGLFFYKANANTGLKIVREFNFDEEANIPTFFSVFILLLNSILLFVCSKISKADKDSNTIQWLLLSIMFLFFALDEFASLHEMIITPLRNILHLSGIFTFSWVILGLIFVIFFFIIYLKFFLKLPVHTKISFFLFFFLYFGGAVGFELIGGYFFSNYGGNNLTYYLLTTVEETFEMCGALILINGLLYYIKNNTENLQIAVK